MSRTSLTSDRAAGPDGGGRAPLTEPDAEEHVRGSCFGAGAPGTLGVELEWLVCAVGDPSQPVPRDLAARALAALEGPGALPGNGRLTVEPGGQLELSSAPAAGIGACAVAASLDMTELRNAAWAAGLELVGQGLDPVRPPRRVLELPRYSAMEEFFDRGGPWGRMMMCSTASVQVCVEAGQDRAGPGGFRYRWRLLHALGPVLVAAFANSPMREGRPTGWKSTRQAVWARLDPTRTRAPAGAEPDCADTHGAGADGGDPRRGWARYALDARVVCVRRAAPQRWNAPAGLTFRDWLRGAGDRPPTRDDLSYHLSTLFPPVRPRGHLEVRVIDAQPADGWIVPAAVVSALLDDPAAADQALEATQRVWHGSRAEPGNATASPWRRAALLGPADAQISQASQACFAAAAAALHRGGAPQAVITQVAAFTERYVTRGRCPADDILEDGR